MEFARLVNAAPTPSGEGNNRRPPAQPGLPGTNFSNVYSDETTSPQSKAESGLGVGAEAAVDKEEVLQDTVYQVPDTEFLTNQSGNVERLPARIFVFDDPRAEAILATQPSAVPVVAAIASPPGLPEAAEMGLGRADEATTARDRDPANPADAGRAHGPENRITGGSANNHPVRLALSLTGSLQPTVGSATPDAPTQGTRLTAPRPTLAGTSAVGEGGPIYPVLRGTVADGSPSGGTKIVGRVVAGSDTSGRTRHESTAFNAEIDGTTPGATQITEPRTKLVASPAPLLTAWRSDTSPPAAVTQTARSVVPDAQSSPTLPSALGTAPTSAISRLNVRISSPATQPATAAAKVDADPRAPMPLLSGDPETSQADSPARQAVVDINLPEKAQVRHPIAAASAWPEAHLAARHDGKALEATPTPPATQASSLGLAFSSPATARIIESPLWMGSPSLPSGTEVVRHIAPQVVNAINSGSGSGYIELRLDPPELGQVEIKLEIVDQTLRATLTAERPAIGEMMRRYGDMFLEQLKQSGFDDVDLRFTRDNPGSRHGEPGRQAPDEHFPGASTAQDDATPSTATANRHIQPDGLDLRL